MRDQIMREKFKSRAEYFAKRQAKQEAIRKIGQSLIFKYKADEEHTGYDKHSPEGVFFGSMVFTSLVSAILFILLICMVKKRAQRLKHLEAFKTGQKMMLMDDKKSDEAGFLKTQLGKELRRQLILGDINKFEDISKAEESKR